MKTYPLALGSVGLISGLLLFSSADAVDTEDVKPNPRAVDTSSSFQNPANVINASTSPVFELRHNVRHPQASDAAIRLIVSPGRRILERIDRVHSLSTNLNVEEIHDLYAFLTAAPAKNENLPALHYLKNEIFTALRNQGTFPAGLTEVMIAISEDSRQDLVTRDYALQHLSIWCGEGAEDEAGSAQRIRNTLIQAAQQPTTLAGTALLGLHRLSFLDGGLEAKRINDLALNIIRDQEMPNATRITATAICGERKAEGALPVIEAVALDKSSPMGLRISAVGALGQIGKVQSVKLLRKLEASERDPVIRGAVAAALGRLKRDMASRGPL